MFNKISPTITFIIAGLTLLVVAGCGASAAAPSPIAPPPLAEELIFYDWEEDIPQSVLEAFTEETGVKVKYVAYETQREAIENLRAGEIYDVVVVDNDNVPPLIDAGLLAEINYANVPNFKNISANFIDLAYDPGNKHSVPFNWGTTALVVRSDLVQLKRWGDLWELELPGKIAFRDDMREPLAASAKSLGYSINTENPKEVEEMVTHLLELRPKVVIVDSYAEGALPMLISGEAVAMMGWAEDVLESRDLHEAITYVIPEEGPMLWGDNYVIPAKSPRKYTAELFLDFLLRPEIGAQIVNENYYANANLESLAFVDAELREDPAIFPPADSLDNGEVFLPLSPEGEALFQKGWEQFKAAGP